MLFPFGLPGPSAAKATNEGVSGQQQHGEDAQQEQDNVQAVVGVPRQPVGPGTEVSRPFVAHHILHPEDGLVHGRHGLISVYARQPLHVVPVAVVMKQLLEASLETLAVNFVEFEDLPRSSLLKTEEVVKLVEEQGHAEHGDAVVYSLLDPVGSTVGYKDSGLRVAQEVFLRHPLHYHGVVAQRGRRGPFVPPYYLIRDHKVVNDFCLLTQDGAGGCCILVIDRQDTCRACSGPAVYRCCLEDISHFQLFLFI